ncbi:MAG: hypothetical protein LBC42_00660 [Puniceicoccales bacterium]|jgi:hypothetical protein|nr:hypothetical protein [Puniceicoccales bacterium]
MVSRVIPSEVRVSVFGVLDRINDSDDATMPDYLKVVYTTNTEEACLIVNNILIRIFPFSWTLRVGLMNRDSGRLAHGFFGSRVECQYARLRASIENSFLREAMRLFEIDPNLLSGPARRVLRLCARFSDVNLPTVEEALIPRKIIPLPQALDTGSSILMTGVDDTLRVELFESIAGLPNNVLHVGFVYGAASATHLLWALHTIALAASISAEDRHSKKATPVQKERAKTHLSVCNNVSYMTTYENFLALLACSLDIVLGRQKSRGAHSMISAMRYGVEVIESNFRVWLAFFATFYGIPIVPHEVSTLAFNYMLFTGSLCPSSYQRVFHWVFATASYTGADQAHREALVKIGVDLIDLICPGELRRVNDWFVLEHPNVESTVFQNLHDIKSSARSFSVCIRSMELLQNYKGCAVSKP